MWTSWIGLSIKNIKKLERAEKWRHEKRSSTGMWQGEVFAISDCLVTSPPEGVARYCFHPVCLSVCVCVSVCPADILVFYFSAIRRDIDLKFIQDTYRVVLNSLTIIYLHRSKVRVTGTVHCFLKVQSYHKNWAIEKFQFFFHRHLLGAVHLISRGGGAL